jgi:hypothetical protein
MIHTNIAFQTRAVKATNLTGAHAEEYLQLAKFRKQKQILFDYYMTGGTIGHH